MGMTIFFLAFMAFLFKFSDINKWWLWFSVLVGLAGQFGYELGMFGLIVAVAVFCLYSAILLWHWKEYSMGKYTTVANMLVYLGVGVACLIVMGLAAVWYGL